MLQSVDSLSDILFRLEHLNPKNPEEEALRERLSSPGQRTLPA